MQTMGKVALMRDLDVARESLEAAERALTAAKRIRAAARARVARQEVGRVMRDLLDVPADDERRELGITP